MRILVTGSAGHVGSKLAVNLYNKGYEVTGADMSKPIDMSFQQIVADLSRWDEVKDLGVYDVIYHIAGHSAGDLSIINYEDDIRGNILTTANIIKLAQLTGTQQIIYTSSMAVYGDQPTYPVREDATPMPRVYYGANKLASEYYLKIASTENLNTCSLRLFNTYGPGQDINNLNQGMVSIFLGELIEKKHFEMRGSPDRFRDFLYIDDAVDGLVSCLGNNGINGEVINLASGTKSTLGELLELIRSKLPFETTVSYTAPSDFDLSGMHGDIEKAKRLLNFNPKVGLSEGLDKMVKWALGEKK
ncbi:NAD(P)-dependent oxidoreductase [Candidatus Dojkabacteria bacterium]|jgi:UDP-glucose 4-epimerase|nr:NAD(P)-dependent oxidoreductase [Candidatus Dojkabacteria bacterium]